MNSKMRSCLLALTLALTSAACSHHPVQTKTGNQPTLLLISIDGLRPQDINAEDMPNLWQLAETGVRGEGMRPAYPSLTFPNHYTLVTGLPPDKHGIVHNSMHDAELGEFRLNLRKAVQDRRWWGGEPVWVSAEKAGLRTATLYWPGSEAAIGDIQPRTWLLFNSGTHARWRADKVADWLTAPARQRPAFATLYFDKVDHASHSHGPNSSQARTERRNSDAAIGHLLARLRDHKQLDDINIVVVSDHGFSEVPPGQAIAVTAMVPPDWVDVISTGQVVGFALKPATRPQAEQRLLGRHEHYQCWRKSELPERWAYGQNPRVPEIICQMDEGWDALTDEKFETRKNNPRMRGSHGYDPALPSMHASFIAHGPAFRPGTTLPVFDNVDVYPLLMRLIGLPEAANDGNVRTFDAVLQD
ncbi:MAG: ectonucleotide pyrophosphatase/phosphodiesterase [Pseudomonadota bacterium]|nr:ectonucleotide pyrophosphatase/phosphodiesterase [Pseudomonadota bacterium]